MNSVLALCLVLSLAVGKSIAFPGECYLNCAGRCAGGIVDAPRCFMCVKNCMENGESSPMELNHMDNRYFCKLGCSTALCTKFLINKHPADEKVKVKDCESSCSQRCTNTMN